MSMPSLARLRASRQLTAASRNHTSRRAQPIAFRTFHASVPRAVKVGDSIPDVELMEGSPGNKVSIGSELKSGKGLVIGVPAAYSPTCSEGHVPGFLSSPKLKDAGKVFVVSVNDAFVMKAWGKILDPDGKTGARFIADPTLSFTNGLDLAFDGSAIFGGHRGKRYVLITEDGKVKEAFVEPDNTGFTITKAENVLK